MISITGTVVNTPPSALEVIFYGGLPSIDRKTDTCANAFPLAFYPGHLYTSEEVVNTPTSYLEPFNTSTLTLNSFNFIEGYSAQGVSGTTTITYPSYSFIDSTYTEIYLNKSEINNKIELWQPSSAIELKGVISDQCSVWTPQLTNGIVYKDINLSAEEVTSSVSGSGSWLSTAGFNVGDRIRLIYTIPNDTLHRSISDSGEKILANNRVYTRIIKGEAVHNSNGYIQLGDINIYAIESISELSTLGENVIVEGVSIKEDGNYSGINIFNSDLKLGNFYMNPAPSEGAVLAVTYIKESPYIEYRGFYSSEHNVWQGLDINPSKGHIYNSGIDTIRTNISSESLIYNLVSMYLLPVAAIKLNASNMVEYPIKYYSAYVEGNKPLDWMPLRHYVSSESRGSSITSTTQVEAASWGYALFDKSTYVGDTNLNSLDKGIPYNLDSALLLGKLKIKPYSITHVIDSRRFSGLEGNYERKSILQSNSEIGSRWDISSWEKVTSPISSGILVDVDSSILEEHSKEKVQSIVNKYVPLGTIGIVREK